MIAEAALATTAHSTIPKLIKGTVCMLGKQTLERSAREVLDRALKPSLVAPIACQSKLQQALFALDADESESHALEELFRSETFEGMVRACGLFAGTDPAPIPAQVSALNEIFTKLLPARPIGVFYSLSVAVVDYIVGIAQQSWETAAKLGAIGDAWASESVITTQVADEVSNAQKMLHGQMIESKLQLHEIGVFVDRYKEAVVLGNSTIRPQSASESSVVPVEDLYVEPMVNLASDAGGTACKRDMLFASARRSVLLGNPGGGKSTLATKLCRDICSGRIDSNYFDVPRLAALIVLRDYAQFVKAHPCSIIEYLGNV